MRHQCVQIAKGPSGHAAVVAVQSWNREAVVHGAVAAYTAVAEIGELETAVAAVDADANPETAAQENN